MKKLLFALLVCACPAQSQDTDDFVTANLLSVFYHELGHAMIDLMRLPVFGQEEDAADVASVLLIDLLYEEESAIEIAYNSAFGFLADADNSVGEVAWWDVHGPDLQRYYNLVCLFAGADLSARDDIAQELGLPDERLEGCEEEYDLAYDSWGPVFDDLGAQAPGNSIRFEGTDTGVTGQLIADEVAELNADFVFPDQLTVRVEPCGEANAFYDPNEATIIMCTEFEDWLRSVAP